MAVDVMKVLGQVVPAATTLTTLYTVPASTSAVGSSLVICNRGAAGSFRVSVAVDGAADDVKQYIYYDQPINANITLVVTIGLSVGSSDVIRVYASTGNFSFSLFGVEVSA